VDDEPNRLEGFRLGLRRGPYEVLCARSTQEAFGVLRRQDVDVLITDEQLPGRSGSELLAFVARYAPSTTRVLLTGYSTRPPMDRAIKPVQVFRLLRKPFSPEAGSE
jgi:serine/threonine-protein kinase